MSLVDVYVKWTKIFANDLAFVETLVDQMKKEHKQNAIRNIYSISKFKKTIECWVGVGRQNIQEATYCVEE